MNAGISFSPAQNQPTGQVGGGMSKPGATPLQDAIRLLSFKLPTNVGASAVSPSQIMGGPSPMGAQLGNGVANNWLMALFRGLNPAASGGVLPSMFPSNAMAGMGSASLTPNITTGVGVPDATGAGSSLPGAMAPQHPQAPTQTLAPPQAAPSGGGWTQDIQPSY